MIGNPADFYNADDASTAWANPATFTEIVPVANFGAVNIANTVITDEVPENYTVTIVGANGTATADKATATPGSTVTLTVTPAARNRYNNWSTPLAAGVTAFTMPTANVTVTVLKLTGVTNK